MEKKVVLGIILGDHAGSSPEMVAKAVLANEETYIPVLTGNLERFCISCQHTGSFHSVPFGGRGGIHIHLQRGLHICVIQNFRFNIHTSLNATYGKRIPWRVTPGICVGRSAILGHGVLASGNENRT